MRRLALPVLLLGLGACVSTPPVRAWRPVDAAALERDLTLEEAVGLARNNDVRAAAWQARFDGARAGLVAASAIPNPTLGLEWEGLGLRESGMSLASLKAGVSFPLLFWIPRRFQRAEACSQRDAERHAIRAERRALAAEVGTAWYGLLAGQRKVKITSALSEDARAALALAKKAQAAGVRSTYDVERAEAEALEAEGEATAAASQLRIDRLAFAFALGADRPALPRAAEPPAPPQEATPAEVIPPDLVALALAGDPAYAKAKATVAATEAELHLQQVGAIPLTGVTGSLGTKDEPGLGNGGTAALEIPLPLFDRNCGPIARARADLLAARAAEEQARRAVLSDLAQAWERVRATSVRYERFARPLTELRVKVEAKARALYAQAEIDQGEWLQTQRDVRTAQKNEVDAWRDAAVSRFQLETLLGRHD